MQHPHRTTLWRRKRKPASNRGRNRRGNAREKFNVRLLAKLLRAFYETGRHGKKRAVSMSEAKDAPVDQTCRAIERALWLRSEPVGLMVLAAWEHFRPEEWRRRNTARGAGLAKAKRLKVKFKRNDGTTAIEKFTAVEKAAVKVVQREHGLSQQKAVELIAAHRGEPWIAALVNVEGSGVPRASDAPAELACPSNFFKISRSTLSYYRNVKPRKREALGNELRLLGVAPPHYLAR